MCLALMSVPGVEGRLRAYSYKFTTPHKINSAKQVRRGAGGEGGVRLCDCVWLCGSKYQLERDLGVAPAREFKTHPPVHPPDVCNGAPAVPLCLATPFGCS